MNERKQRRKEVLTRAARGFVTATMLGDLFGTGKLASKYLHITWKRGWLRRDEEWGAGNRYDPYRYFITDEGREVLARGKHRHSPPRRFDATGLGSFLAPRRISP